LAALKFNEENSMYHSPVFGRYDEIACTVAVEIEREGLIAGQAPLVIRGAVDRISFGRKPKEPSANRWSEHDQIGFAVAVEVPA
jgi:hypothetical protein